MNAALIERARELTKGVHIRLAENSPTDAESFTALFNETYTRTIIPEYFQWQFFRGPLPGRCLFAELGGKLVGCYGVRPIIWNLVGRDAIFGLTVDLIVDPSQQGSGLFLRLESEMLGHARELGCALIYSFPNEKVFRPRVDHLGWRSPGDIEFLEHRPQGERGRTQEMEISPAPGPACAQIDGIFSSAHAHRAHARRSAQYLAWRYSESPWYDYTILRFSPKALAVVKLFQGASETNGDIVDLIWAEEDPYHLASILKSASQYLYSQGASSISMWANLSTMDREAASLAGFVSSGHMRRFCYLPLDNENIHLKDRSSWYLTMGDSEIF